MSVLCCAQSCLTFCGPMDCSPPGSYVHGIFQARIVEWVAISLPANLPHPGIESCLLCLLHWQVYCLHLRHLGRHLGSPEINRLPFIWAYVGGVFVCVSHFKFTWNPLRVSSATCKKPWIGYPETIFLSLKMWGNYLFLLITES